MAFKSLYLLCALPCLLFAEIGYVEPWGKESDLIAKIDHNPIPCPRNTPLASAMEKVILFHQKVLSPVDGPRSHFRPTSSRYMLLSIRRYGFFKGYVMGCDRLLRENKEEWVYRKRMINGEYYKWDPTY